jgi:hypothetical protein
MVAENRPMLTLVVPCWGRPLSTRRLLLDVVGQTVDRWEALFVGDCCPLLDRLFDEPIVNALISECEVRGNTIKKVQLDKNYGGFGYQAMNTGISLARGEFTIFAGNDDRLSPVHFQNYLYPVMKGDLDLVLFDSVIKGLGLRKSELKLGSVGHSEIIVRSSVAKRAPAHGPEYGHDWRFILDLMSLTGRSAKDLRGVATYNVTRLKDDPPAD